MYVIFSCDLGLLGIVTSRLFGFCDSCAVDELLFCVICCSSFVLHALKLYIISLLEFFYFSSKRLICDPTVVGLSNS